jgi:hypothetical protein
LRYGRRRDAGSIKHYAVEDGVQTWQLADFENVKRTKITHTIGAS